jgi:hypothetical protein
VVKAGARVVASAICPRVTDDKISEITIDADPERLRRFSFAVLG